MRLRLLGLALLVLLVTGPLIVFLCTDAPSSGGEARAPITDAAEAGTQAQQPSMPRSGRTSLGRPPVRELSAPSSRFARFSGRHFSVAYPTGWIVETSEVSKGAYVDTTIRHPRSPDTYLRVDVSLKLGRADPARHALRAEAYLRSQPGYRRLAFRRTVLGSSKALRWEFTVRESGVLLRKVDVFLTDTRGNGFAVLTQAPVREFPNRSSLFEQLLSSLAPRASAV